MRAKSDGTPIIKADEFVVSYATSPGSEATRTNLAQAMRSWRQVYYWGTNRELLLQVQKALHDAQPVITSWFVDFNAMENRRNELLGSLNMKTLSAICTG